MPEHADQPFALAFKPATRQSVLVPTQGDHLASIRRPFNWGVVLVSHHGSKEVPLDLDEGGFGTSATALAFAVRHAQDVDLHGIPENGLVPLAEVTVEVTAGPPVGPTARQHVLDIPSGTLSIGDADGEELIPIQRPRCRVSVALDEPQHAEHARVWVEPLDG